MLNNPKIIRQKCYRCGHHKFSIGGTNSKPHCTRCKKTTSKLITVKNKNGKTITKIIDDKGNKNENKRNNSGSKKE